MSHRLLPFLVVLMWLSWPSLGLVMAQDDDPRAACDRAAATAERSHGLPSGILAAIGRVESGRADTTGSVVPWPWTIDAAGAGEFLPSVEAAVDAVRALQQRGLRNIDVGCFQVNLEQHPDAFDTLAAAFDPQVNADYAAGFLSGLRRRTGNWDAAVAAYHSALAARGIPYRGQVFAQWAGMAARADVSTQADRGGSVVIAGVRVWTPGTAGTARRVIRIASPDPLPPTQSASLTK
jgi:Transglycosylase SLT domain